MDGLTPCPNPIRFLRIGRLMIVSQWAQDYWAKLDKSGNRVRIWFGIETMKARDGDEEALVLTIHRLVLGFSWMRPADPQ